jgi:hypothetical protein
LSVWRDALDALEASGVLRSTGGPVGDYAEWLVATALGLTRVPYPTPAIDALAADGIRYSVKARRWGRTDRPTRVRIGDLDRSVFDVLVFVLLTDDMAIERAVALPYATLRGLLLSNERDTTVGRLLGAPEARDLTDELRVVVPGARP